MKIFRRILSAGIVAAISISILPSVFANEAEKIILSGETVLYYNSFPTGTDADLTEVEHSEYYFYGRNDNLKKALNETFEYSHAIGDSYACGNGTYKNSLNPLTASEFNGETGARLNKTSATVGSGPIVMFDFRYSDADKTPTPNGTLATGIYKFSFDFVLYDDTVSTVDAFRVQANCRHTNYGNAFTWVRNNEWYNLNGKKVSALASYITESSIPISDNELHHYEIIFDLDNNNVITYMDGIRRKDTEYTGNINFLHLTMGGSVKFLDNLLLTKMDPEYVTEMDVKINSCDENGVELQFSEYIDDISVLETLDFTDMFTGDIIDAKVVGVADSLHTVRIEPETSFIPGHEYLLNADIEIEGLRGGTVVLESQSISVGDLKSIKISDFNGEKKPLSKDTVAEIDSFVFEFKDGDAVAKLLDLTLLDEDENEIELSVTQGELMNFAKATVSGVLKGNREYILSFSDAKNDYSWSFTTGNGKFSLKPIKFFESDGVTPVSLLEVESGDKIKAKYECVNTGDEIDNLSFVLIMGLYSGKGLTYIDYVKVELEDSAESYSTMVEFEVSKTDDLNAQGFIWKSLDTRTPLYKHVISR